MHDTFRRKTNPVQTSVSNSQFKANHQENAMNLIYSIYLMGTYLLDVFLQLTEHDFFQGTSFSK
jgi:hypothetical protein